METAAAMVAARKVNRARFILNSGSGPSCTEWDTIAPSPIASPEGNHLRRVGGQARSGDTVTRGATAYDAQSMDHPVTALRFATRFRCTADACEDTCCAGL